MLIKPYVLLTYSIPRLPEWAQMLIKPVVFFIFPEFGYPRFTQMLIEPVVSLAFLIFWGVRTGPEPPGRNVKKIKESAKVKN